MGIMDFCQRTRFMTAGEITLTCKKTFHEESSDCVTIAGNVSNLLNVNNDKRQRNLKFQCFLKLVLNRFVWEVYTRAKVKVSATQVVCIRVKKQG